MSGNIRWHFFGKLCLYGYICRRFLWFFYIVFISGEVQEWLNWLPWKGSVLARVPWVRIPPSPLNIFHLRFKRYRGFSHRDSRVAIDYPEESHPLRSLKLLFNFFALPWVLPMGLQRCYCIRGGIPPSPLNKIYLRFNKYRGFSQWDSRVAIEYPEESHPLRSIKFLYNFLELPWVLPLVRRTPLEDSRVAIEYPKEFHHHRSILPFSS